MAVVYEVKSFKEMERHLSKLLKKKQRKIKKIATDKAIRFGMEKIAELVPKAFEDLVHSIKQVGTAIIVDAPHAAAVEIGSRPHMPPLEPLVKWVKLRGMQGLTKGGKIISSKRVLKNGQDASSAQMVALVIRGMRRKNKFTDVDIPTQIAKRIQIAISKVGTQPRFYVKNAMPYIAAFFLEQIMEVMNQVES